jgi:hypothetical protein
VETSLFPPKLDLDQCYLNSREVQIA